MIYVTGDTHIPFDISKLNKERFPQQKEMTRDDYVIILGDFGLHWRNDGTYRHWRKWLTEKPFTALWIDGNHDNHEWINSMPITEWHGGRVHQTEENIIHLMRGNHYEIDGLHFFAAGGAQSYDRRLRTPGVSWWKEELWSYGQQQLAFDTIQGLKISGTRIDYVLSHTCPESIIQAMLGINPAGDPDSTTRILDWILEDIGADGFKGWYFGHWHKDEDFGKFHCLYNEVRRIL